MYSNITVRSFSLWLDENPSDTFEVVQLYYEDWPDHGAPATTESIRTLAQLVTSLQQRSIKSSGFAGPPVVHCSAGIGRAGTFATIHIILTKMDKILNAFNNTSTSNPCFGIKDLVAELRKQREGLVQTVDQYVFVHRAIVDTLRTIKRNSLKKNNDSNTILSSFCSSPSPAPSSSTDDNTTSHSFHNSKDYGCNILDIFSLRNNEHTEVSAQVR
eukprot:TRINITY_DN27045_c0_g1_i1.p2 TRINITY_DN27045_c0_g1~~TRINITY_DN27045_c0_g1_i1.p2  ORF type:complete len:215 (+),score=31.54 TRINITY_DN27045_c0_g1_i1:572-1216(+)